MCIRGGALADTSRRAMLVRLAQGPASVSALAQPLAMSLQAVMQVSHIHNRLCRRTAVG